MPFSCGHGQHAQNWKRDKRGYRYCVQCRSEQGFRSAIVRNAMATPVVFKKCQHPRSEANVLINVRGYAECRTCRRDKDRRRRGSRRVPKPPPMPMRPILVPREPLDLSSDPAVQLARAEKAKRVERDRPKRQAEWDAICVEWARVQQAQLDAQKGGRPRKSA